MWFHIHEVQEQAKLTNGDPIRAEISYLRKVAARWVLGLLIQWTHMYKFIKLYK